MRILSAKFIISMLLIGAFYLPINAYNYLDDVALLKKMIQYIPSIFTFSPMTITLQEIF